MTSSDAQQDQAKEYQKIKQKLSLFHLAFTPAILLAALLTPLSFLFKEWAMGLSDHLHVILGFYLLFLFVYLTVLDLPFSFYSSFQLEHRFNLSNHTVGSWIREFLKKALISFAFMLLLIECLYALIWNFSTWWWVFAWAGYTLFSYVLGKLFPVFIVPLFYKYGEVEDAALKTRILDLAKRFQMPVENVYSLNLSKTTKKANAAFMGMGKTKRVVLSDTLLENFSNDEIETVVAHELGHFTHRDIWRSLFFGMVTSFISFAIVYQVMNWTAVFFEYSDVGDVMAMPILFLSLHGFALCLMPLQNAFSRWMERAADRFALDTCRLPEVFISCMEKLGKVNLADPTPNPVYEWFFYDHPAIGKRIQMARDWIAKK